MKTIYCENFLRDLDQKEIPAGSALTMGNFDGCHKAHQEILLSTKKEAQKWGGSAVALTFDPHPRDFFEKSPEQGSRRLFTLGQKLDAFEKMGIDIVLIQKFDHNFSQVSHEDFYEKGIKQKIRAKAVLVGENFCFGQGRHGTSAWLKERGEKDKLCVHPVPLKKIEGVRVNSTHIRDQLHSGEVHKVQELMGKPFTLVGVVERGAQKGRVIGFPTANLGSLQQIIPALGVYFGFFSLSPEGPKDLAVLNIGKRPTVHPNSHKITVEAHCLEKQYDYTALYGKTCYFSFLERLRNEQKFSSFEELRAQIQKDIQEAQKRALQYTRQD